MVSETGYLIALLVACVAAYAWKYFCKFYLRKSCKVIFDWKDPSRVGKTVSFRLKFEKDENETSARNLSFSRKTSIEICRSNAQTVSYITEPRQTENAFEMHVKFSVQQSGTYSIHVRYNGIRVAGSPFTKVFLPGEADPKKTTFLRPCPTLSVVAYKTAAFDIQPKDRFGNICRMAEVNLDAFAFTAKIADESRRNEVLSYDQYSYKFNLVSGYIERLKFFLDFFPTGVYNGTITYNGEELHNGSFDIVVMDCYEDSLMQNILNDNPGWTYHEAKLLAIGSEIQKKIRKMYIYVSPKLFYIREYFLKIFPKSIATFRISSMTKINMLITNDDEKTYTFSIFDGIGPKITLEMNSTSARIVMGMFHHFLRRRLGIPVDVHIHNNKNYTRLYTKDHITVHIANELIGNISVGGTETFEGKQRVFYEELRGTLKDIRISLLEVKIDRNELLLSSMAATKNFRAPNWCKSFRIKFVDELGIDTGGLRREWLELLCVKMFDNNKDGMFAAMGNSRLVHPNAASSRHEQWTIKHYNFAGKVVGKCLFESSWGDMNKQMVNGRFSRSFFAQIIGLRPEYKHFEQDDPELYLGKVKYILETDMDTMEPPQITFTEEEYNSKGALVQTIELVVNGSKKIVTNENKEEYLNALANYRLGVRVKKEVEAFVKGLHEIVPDELLTNFDENELELLLCGKSEFDLEDLKKYHVDGGWHWDPTYTRILTWFFTAIANMTEDERARLLQFTTGSSLLPHGGFKALNPLFKITLASSYGKLPTAHTCFNQICLYDQPSFEVFERALKIAIQEGGEGFSFA